MIEFEKAINRWRQPLPNYQLLSMYHILRYIEYLITTDDIMVLI